MIDVSLGKHTVLLYDSIIDMPCRQYQQARQYEVMRAELGQSEEELNGMLAKADQYVQAGQLDAYREQMRNYRLARAMVKEGFQAAQLDWACRVASIDGKAITDYSEDALLAQIEQWSRWGLTQRLVEEKLDDVKKNSSPS